MSHLPTDAKERKKIPLYSGLVKYFPDALVEVARLSQVGNDQHNPGQPLHWDRSKSTDEHDTLLRHLFDAGTFDKDGIRHSAKVAWRALAALQKEIEEFGAPRPEYYIAYPQPGSALMNYFEFEKELQEQRDAHEGPDGNPY
jgi:hypothetical protein